jgi:putative cardiolipin synthase
MIALPQRSPVSVHPGTAHLERKRDYAEKRRAAARLPLGAATAWLVLAALLAGCAHIKPAPIAEERALPAAASPLWTNVAAAWPGDDRFSVLNSGHDAYEWRLRAIDSASSSLDLQTFLWKEDRAGGTILARILAAADRGVRIRILLDDSFTVGEGDTISALTRHPNIQFRIYNPFARRPDDLVLRQIANATDFDRVDHRMHNKVMITDTQAAIVGGRNLADEYFGLHPSANFRDLEVVAVGPVVAELARVFDSYWQSPWSIPAADVVGTAADGRALEQLRTRLNERHTGDPGTSPTAALEAWQALVAEAAPGSAEVLADEPARSDPAKESPTQLAAGLIARIDAAVSEVVLVSAYLVPTPELADSLRRAVHRGVRVRILTNSLRSNNHTAAHSAYRGFIRSLIGYGVELHEVRALAKDRGLYMAPPVDTKHLGLHAKAILFDDDLSFVGSANLDPRSLEINTEMGLIIRSTGLNARLRAALGVDFDTRNAWHLQELPDGELRWVGDDAVLSEQPAESELQRLEDWFFSKLPIRDKM